MKHLYLHFIALLFMAINTLAQSPILGVPPNYIPDMLNPSFSLPLPPPAIPHPVNGFNEFIDDGNLNGVTTGSQIYAYDGRPAKSTSNTIFGPNGELAAFIIDEYVFDKNGYLLDVLNNNGLYFGLGESEIAVIPNPQNCNKYYLVFTTVDLRGNQGNYILNNNIDYDTRPYYAVLDLSLDRANKNYNENLFGGLMPFSNGDLITPLFDINESATICGSYNQQQLPNTNFLTRFKEGKFTYAVTSLNANNERFLFTEHGGVIHRYKVNGNEITLDFNKPDYTNTVEQFFCVNFNQNIDYNYSELIFIEDFLPNPGFTSLNRFHRKELEIIQLANGNYRLALSYEQSILGPASDTYLVTLEFDNNGVFIQNSENVVSFKNSISGSTHIDNSIQQNLDETPYIMSLEFSPTGNIVYAVTAFDPAFPNEPVIRFFDFNNPSVGMQHLNIPNENDFASGYVEMGLNNKMYFSSNGKLGALSDVENPIVSNFNANEVLLPNYVISNNYQSPLATNSIQYAGFTLPDQIDGEDWQERFNAVECEECEFFNVGAVNYTAEFSQTWSPGNNPFGSADGTVYINGDLTIPSGVNITMNNMKFIFSETSQLNVQVGGKLTANNYTLLTSRACEGLMWQGVRVEGNPNLGPIPSTNQGNFLMTNGSEIRNAYIGVTNYRTTVNPNDVSSPVADLAFVGGKVIASNSIYRNNVRDVSLRFYRKPNSSYQFTKCEFITDDAILDGSYPQSHVSLLFVGKVIFRGCDFKNTTTGIYADDDRGRGIESTFSLFEVTFFCPNQSIIPIICANKERSSFYNLYRGVRASSGGGFLNSPAIVKYSDFDRVSLGVHYINADNSFCVNNNFTNIGPLTSVTTAANSSSSGAYGLHLDHCTGYAVENNTFESSAYLNDTYGIIVVNSNNNGTIPDANVIYNNEFEKLNYGIVGLLENVGISQNGNTEVGSGLQLRCNDFQNNIYNNDISWVRGGISPFQGNTNLNELPNNVFYGSSWDLANYNTQLIQTSYKYQTNYLYYSNTNGYNIEPLFINPLVLNTTVSPIVGSFNPIVGCPVNQFEISRRSLLGGKLLDGKNLLSESENLKNEIANADVQVISLMAQRQSNAISVGNYKNAINDYAKLLNDDRLIDQLSLGLPPGILKNILEVNAPLSNEVAVEIDNAQLPKGIKNQLKTLKVNANQIPANQNKIAEAGYLEIKSKLLINEVIREYLTDTTIINGIDSATLLMEEYNKFYNKCRRVEQYVGKGDYLTAEIVLDSIRDLNKNQDENLTNFCEYYSLMIEIAQIDETCGIIKTDSTYKQRVESFAEISSTDRTCLRANSLLRAFFENEYNELFPDLVQYKSMHSPIIKEEEIYTPTKMLLVYPNPSSDIFNIMIDDENSTNGTIEVYDNVGKLILTKQINNSLGYIEMQQFPKGIYQVVVTSQDGNTYFDRIILK